MTLKQTVCTQKKSPVPNAKTFDTRQQKIPKKLKFPNSRQ